MCRDVISYVNYAYFVQNWYLVNIVLCCTANAILNYLLTAFAINSCINIFPSEVMLYYLCNDSFNFHMYQTWICFVSSILLPIVMTHSMCAHNPNLTAANQFHYRNRSLTKEHVTTEHQYYGTWIWSKIPPMYIWISQ